MNEKQPNLKVISAVICDEVRRESNGKDIIIGAYGGNVLVGEFPRNISLALWINVTTIGSGHSNVHIRVIDAKNAELAKIEGELFLDPESPIASISTPKITFGVNAPTELKFQWKLGSRRWKTLIKRSIMLRKHS